MINLNDFQIDKKNDGFENVLSVKRIIEDYFAQEKLTKLSKKFANFLNCPQEVISIKSKQILSSKFDYKFGKFSIKYKIFNLIKDFLLILSVFSILKIFNKNISQKKFDIILDDVEHAQQILIFNKLLKKFNDSVIFTKRPFIVNNYELDSLNFKFSNFFLLEKNTTNFKLFDFVEINWKLLRQSYADKFNYFIFFKSILFSFLKYSYLFQKFNAKYLIHDRYYRTCPIRNYIFKKKGGKKICCTQIHLLESSISLFSDIDIFLSFGNENFSKEKFKKLGGNINKSHPVGSIRMEYLFHKKTKIKKYANFDIAFIGINIHNWTYVSEEINKNYYKVFEWLKNISLKFRECEILIKHHPSWWGDPKEKAIIDNTKIKTLLREKKPSKFDFFLNNNLVSKYRIFFENFYIGKDTSKYDKNESYFFLTQSKINFSFGSTMIPEGIGAGKVSYFIDPDLKNTVFLNGLKHLDNLRISKYNDLERLIEEKIKYNKIDKNLDQDEICLKSTNVSERIYKYLIN